MPTMVCSISIGKNLSLDVFPRSGRLSSVNIRFLLAVVEKNPRQTAREIAKLLKTSDTLIVKHLH